METYFAFPGDIAIYCGDNMFLPFPSAEGAQNIWVDQRSQYFLQGTSHGNNVNARICGTSGQSYVLRMASMSPGASNQVSTKIIGLCDSALTKGMGQDSTGSRAGLVTISALSGRAGLFPGKLISDVAETACLSYVLFYALALMTSPTYCQ